MAYIMDTNEEERVKGITVEVHLCCMQLPTGSQPR
jgi:translation elongation factor EF-1alpha